MKKFRKEFDFKEENYRFLTAAMSSIMARLGLRTLFNANKVPLSAVNARLVFNLKFFKLLGKVTKFYFSVLVFIQLLPKREPFGIQINLFIKKSITKIHWYLMKCMKNI